MSRTEAREPEGRVRMGELAALELEERGARLVDMVGGTWKEDGGFGERDTAAM